MLDDEISVLICTVLVNLVDEAQETNGGVKFRDIALEDPVHALRAVNSEIFPIIQSAVVLQNLQ